MAALLTASQTVMMVIFAFIHLVSVENVFWILAEFFLMYSGRDYTDCMAGEGNRLIFFFSLNSLFNAYWFIRQ